MEAAHTCVGALLGDGQFCDGEVEQCEGVTGFRPMRPCPFHACQEHSRILGEAGFHCAVCCNNNAADNPYGYSPDFHRLPYRVADAEALIAERAREDAA
jgi:hypothetical protein